MKPYSFLMLLKNKLPFCSFGGFLIATLIPVNAATLTISNYTGTVPILNGGQFNNLPGASNSGGVGSTIVTSSTAITGTLSGTNPVPLGGDYVNTGFGATINLVAGPGETFDYQLLAIQMGGASGFDDGVRIDYNGITVLDFDYSSYQNDPDVRSLFSGAAWAPWQNQGSPALELDAFGLRLMVTAKSNGTGSAAGVLAGQRINLLNYFSSNAYVANPTAPDFEAGVQLAIYNRNDAGPWSIARPTITATAAPVPEPAVTLIAACGLLGLLRRRR
jgi:hypothetical protein